LSARCIFWGSDQECSFHLLFTKLNHFLEESCEKKPARRRRRRKKVFDHSKIVLGKKNEKNEKNACVMMTSYYLNFAELE
jgi:hypothetical protein